MGSLSKVVKKIARPKVLLPLAALAIGGPMAAKAIAAKGGIGAALTGTAGAAATGASAAAAPGSLMASGMVAPSLAAGSAAAVPATAGLFGTAGAFAPLKGTLAKGIMYGLKNPFTTKGLMTYGGAGLGLAALMGKEKTEAQKNLGVDAQAQYDLAREMNRMMGGAYTDEQLNTITAPMLSQYGGEYETITDPMRKRRPMFPGLNYSGLTRYAADGGTIVGDDELSQRLYGEMMGAQMSDNTPDIETLQGIKDYIDYLGEMDQAEKALREEVPNPTGRAAGGRIEMGLGGIIGRAIREAMQAAMKNPNLGKVFGRSGGDLDVGDVEKIIKTPPRVAPRDGRLSNIDVFGRRRPRDIDTLQDEVIDQMMEMDSIEGFAHGGSIPQTPMMPQGMQLDGRGGGFIPMGAQEKKDDVPAMLAKNEFVMTSDAVRAAGGGDINKGAQKMYDLMNNLESKV